MPELIFDEMIEENFKSRGTGVFELLGARDYRFPFSSALRANGDPPEAGDTFPCTFVAAPNIRVSCLAVYTPGSPALLDATGGPFWKTSAGGGGLPDFGTKNGIVGLTMPAALQFIKTLAGGIANPDAIRSSVLPLTLEAFKASQALAAGEAVFAQCAQDSPSYANDFLAGLIVARSGVSASADEQTIFATATGGIKGVRQSIKAWATNENQPITSGNTIQVLDCTDPDALYGVYVADRATRPLFCSGLFRGHASAVVPVDVMQSPAGTLSLEYSGTAVLARNTTGGAINVDVTAGRI